jgi:hypothetical protein
LKFQISNGRQVRSSGDGKGNGHSNGKGKGDDSSGKTESACRALGRRRKERGEGGAFRRGDFVARLKPCPDE